MALFSYECSLSTAGSAKVTINDDSQFKLRLRKLILWIDLTLRYVT